MIIRESSRLRYVKNTETRSPMEIRKALTGSLCSTVFKIIAKWAKLQKDSKKSAVDILLQHLRPSPNLSPHRHYHIPTFLSKSTVSTAIGTSLAPSSPRTRIMHSPIPSSSSVAMMPPCATAGEQFNPSPRDMRVITSATGRDKIEAAAGAALLEMKVAQNRR